VTLVLIVAELMLLAKRRRNAVGRIR